MRLALGFFKTSQRASTGTQANAKVNSAAVPVATHIARAMYIGSRASFSEKMRRYCVRMDILVIVKPTQ
jgi:hypothetical protein